MFARVRLVDTMAALVLPFAASALGTFLVRQALLSVPDEIIEAARMDGAGEWTIVYRILAPMLRPTLVSLFLVSFVFHYNDYFWPLVMTTDDAVRTLPLGVALLREQGTGVRWHIVMAGNVVLSAPVLALFAVAAEAACCGAVRGVRVPARTGPPAVRRRRPREQSVDSSTAGPRPIASRRRVLRRDVQLRA